MPESPSISESVGLLTDQQLTPWRGLEESEEINESQSAINLRDIT